MGKSIRDGARAQEHQLGSLSELIHQHVHVAIELAVHEELRAALGATPYERSDVRRGYGNGTKARTLTGPTGAVQLSLPRATLFAGPKEWTSRIRVADTIPCRSRCDLLLPRWVCTARTQWRKGRERAGAGRCRCSHRWPQVPARVGAVRRRIVSHGKAVSMTSSRAGCGRRYWRSSTAILACAALSVRCRHARQSSSVASTSSVTSSGRDRSMRSRRSATTSTASSTRPTPTRPGLPSRASSARGASAARAWWRACAKGGGVADVLYVPHGAVENAWDHEHDRAAARGVSKAGKNARLSAEPGRRHRAALQPPGERADQVAQDRRLAEDRDRAQPAPSRSMMTFRVAPAAVRSPADGMFRT